MSRNIGYATDRASAPLGPWPFDRPAVGAEDVLIDIAFCGVCHSDIHQARDDIGGPLATNYPCMPGHEIVGTVAQVGDQVTAHRVGDRVAVGCLVYWGDESQRGVEDEQYQDPPPIFTYNAVDPSTGEVTFGGYSDQIVVHEHFVLRVPDALELDVAAPLLCAGVTTFAPLRRWGAGPGTRVAVAGLGGLGHIAIKLAKAMGADRVLALTTTPDKARAAEAAGADEVVVMTDEAQTEANVGAVDLILSTIPTGFDMNPYLTLLRPGGVLTTVGLLEPVRDGAIDFRLVTLKKLTIAGSLIGNLAETQEVLDFCADHGVTADIEKISVDEINTAHDRMVDGDIPFRYVIDNSTLEVSQVGGATSRTAPG